MPDKYKIQIVISAKNQSSGVFQSVGSSLSRLGTIAQLGVNAGIGAVAAGLGAATIKGLAFNNILEQTTAQINAFTKDSKQTAQILDTIRDRAAKTPFAFQEMATAAASLIPAAKQSGKDLEELISLAEILAASNPAQGLEGAAFSLREALSGDFVSIVERFNLPRQRLNELKEQGVPALEAVNTAMRELGLDSELVTNLSQTASGRLSTFKDTLITLAATATQPIFNAFSGGLGTINQWLTDNQPLLESFARVISDAITTGLYRLQDAFNVLTGVVTGDTTQIIANLINMGVPLNEAVSFTNTLQTAWSGLNETIMEVGPVIQDALTRLGESIINLGMALGLIDENTSGAGAIISVFAGIINEVAKDINSFAEFMQNVAWAVEQVNAAVQSAIDLYSQLKEVISGLQSVDLGTGLNAVLGGIGGGLTDTYNRITGQQPAINNQIQVNSPPVYLDGQKIADNTSGYQGAAYQNYTALGGIGAQ